MIIQAESKGTKGGGEREKGGLRGGSSWLSEQERASAVLDCSTESEPSGPPISVSPTFSFQLKTQASRILVTFPRSPAHQRYTLCILSNEWLAQEHKEMLQEQLCVPGYKYCFQNQHILLLLLGLSSIYLGTLSHFPKVLGISYWENGSNLILIQVCFLFFLVSIYPQLFLASWWNIPENNLQPHIADSALMLLTWKALGTHYLSIKLLLKDEDLLLGNVLFTSMSLGIRYWAFITNHKFHLRWQRTEMSLLQLLLCAHRIQIRMNPECKSSYLS